MASDATAPLDQYLKPIKDHAKLIGAVAAAVTILGVLVSTIVPTSYQATASVLVTPISTDPSETFESDVVVDMPTEERIATSKTVITLVSQRLAEQSIDIGDDALAVNVMVSSPEESRILDVSYMAATPTLAQTGADTFAQTYLDYRSQLAGENKSAAEETLRERTTLLKDQLAGIEAELTGYEEGSPSFVTLSVERESIKSELRAQQDTLAQLSTLSTDVGRIISPAELPDSPRGLGLFAIVLGALAGGLVLGCVAAYVLATIKSAGAPRNRRADDRPDPDQASTPTTLGAPAVEPVQTPMPASTPDAIPATTAQPIPPPARTEPEVTPPPVPLPEPAPASESDTPPIDAIPEPEPAETMFEPTPALEPDTPPIDAIPEPEPAETMFEPAPALEPDTAPIDAIPEPEPAETMFELPREPARHRPTAPGSIAAVAQQQAMDSFFGPEQEPVDELPSLDVLADEHPTWDADDRELGVDSTWDTGFLDRSIHESIRDQTVLPEPTEYQDPTDRPIDPEYRPTDGAEYSGDSLDAVAAEISAALPGLLGQAPTDLGPIRGSDSGDPMPPPPVAAPSRYDIDRLQSGWQIDEDVEQDDRQGTEAPGEFESPVNGLDPDGPETTGPHAVPPVPPPPPPPPSSPPTLICEADFDPLLQRLHRIGEGRSLSCVCLGEASRDASLAIGFGLADELQSLGVDVLVVDMLLEEPALDRLLGLSARPGLLDILAEEATLDEGARGIAGLGSLRALTVGHEDDLADRRRTNDLINGWSMQRLLDDAGTTFHATVIIGGTLNDARRLNLALQQTDGIVVGTEQMVGEPAGAELDAHLDGLPAEVLALVSVDTALSAASGAPSM